MISDVEGLLLFVSPMLCYSMSVTLRLRYVCMLVAAAEAGESLLQYLRSAHMSITTETEIMLEEVCTIVVVC